MISKKEFLAKYNRIPEDPSQQMQFVEQIYDELTNIPTGTKLYRHTISMINGQYANSFSIKKIYIDTNDDNKVKSQEDTYNITTVIFVSVSPTPFDKNSGFRTSEIVAYITPHVEFMNAGTKELRVNFAGRISQGSISLTGNSFAITSLTDTVEEL